MFDFLPLGLFERIQTMKRLGKSTVKISLRTFTACCSQAVASRCTVVRTEPSSSDNYLMFSVPAATLNGHEQISVDNQLRSGANLNCLPELAEVGQCRVGLMTK